MALVALTGIRAARGPNTALMAPVSTPSLACVPVPWALMASIADGSMAAAASAALDRRRLALDAGPRDVPGVVGEAVAGDLAEHGRAARDGALPGFEHDHRRALAEHHAAAIL